MRLFDIPMIAVLDVMYSLEQKGKAATKRSIENLAGLPRGGVGKALKEANAAGYIVEGSGVRGAWTLTTEGRAIASNDVDVEVKFDSEYIGCSRTREQGTVNLLEAAGAINKDTKLCEDLVAQLGWGRVNTDGGVHVAHRTQNTHIQLHYVRGHWTLYAIPTEASGMTLEQLQVEIGEGKVKRGSVVVKQIDKKIELKDLESIL